MPSLESFPRPHLAVDVVVLTPLRGHTRERRSELGVVVLRRPDGRAVLPGRFVRERQTVQETVTAIYREKLDLTPRRNLVLQMLDVYDDPDRDERAWAVSLGYVTSLRADESERLDGEVLPVHGPASRGRRVTSESLAYDHDQMVTTAVRRARRRYERSPDPLGLLRPQYTLSQLRHVHEAVLDAPLKRDTFNRRMTPYLEPATDKHGEEMYTSETVGRPAQLYRPARRPTRDPEAGPFPLPRSGH